MSPASLSVLSEITLKKSLVLKTLSHYPFLRASRLKPSLPLHSSLCTLSCFLFLFFIFLGTSVIQHTVTASFEHCNFHPEAEEPALCPITLKKTSAGCCPGLLCSPHPLPRTRCQEWDSCPSATWATAPITSLLFFVP